MKKKRKKKRKKHASQPTQQLQATEAFDGHTIAALRKKIALLKRAPKDFRDMTPFSPDWRKLTKEMGSEVEAEMTTWARGGVLTLAPINGIEQEVLNNVVGEHEVHDMATLCYLIRSVPSDVSFIYAPQFEDVTIKGLNQLCSRFKMHFRFKGQLLDGKGYPLGVVY